MKTALYFSLLILVGSLQAKAPIKGDWITASYVRVLAHPERFNGKRILLRGFYRRAFEHSALYLSEGDAKMPNYEQGIWIGSPKKSEFKIEYPKRGWCRVLGTFHYRKHDNDPGSGGGHMGLWFAEIRDVEVLARQE